MDAATTAAQLTAVPTGPAFDIVLLLHVAASLVALGAVLVAGIQAARLLARRPTGEAALPASLSTYYAPGVNWAGRSLYAVPLLGLALLGLSHGAYGFDDRWVQAGLGLWVVAAAGADAVLWPAERRVQRHLAEGTAPGAAVVRRACGSVCLASGTVAALLVAATVVMVARP